MNDESKVVTYVDDRGVNRRVLLPDRFATPEQGIPLDVYDILEDKLQDSPESYRVTLYNELWNRGLVEPQDFAKRDVIRTVRQALQSAFSKDANDIVNLIGESYE